ncbi:MAG TPA: OsmC family peroxiredoxin, partial [Candidatus Ligilactobacillus excrementipullorum]|nr:OsmC family peroxiredoxin [Candidatus Ligilactobacillus excrementipullorum]
LKKFDLNTSGQTERFSDKSSKVSKIKVVFDVETDLGSGDQQHFIDDVLQRCTVHNSLDPNIDYQFEY